MFIDVYLETWNKGKGTHLFYLYPINAADIDSPEIYAYGILNELINREKGHWKDKELWSIDGAWGGVKVKKSDILYFIERVNAEAEVESCLNMDKVMNLDDNKFYALVGCES